MTWVRLDDTFGNHPKFYDSPLGALCQLLQIRAICYASQHLTDGRLPANILDQLTAGFDVAIIGDDLASERQWSEEMVAAKLWEPRKGGFMIHDYLKYNPSKKEVLQLREVRKLAGQAGGQASALAHAKANRKPVARRLLGSCLKQNPTTSHLTSPLHPTSPLTSELHEQGEEEEKTPKPPLGVEALADFEQFYQAYPRKVSREKAEAAWKKLAKEKTLPPLATILNALDVAIKAHEWTAERMQFVPHPASWLNQKRWTDELKPPPLFGDTTKEWLAKKREEEKTHG